LLLSCGQSTGQWTVHPNVDSPVDSPLDGVVVYLQRVELAYSDRSVAPNVAELRPAPTTAALLKDLSEGNLRYGMRVEQERERGGSSSDPILALPAPDAIAIHPASSWTATLASPTATSSSASSTATLTSPTAASSLAASTAETQSTPVVRLDFGSLLPPLTGKERKAHRTKANYEEKMSMAVTVLQSELDGLGTKVLYRVARELGVNVKRTTGQRGWDDIRNDTRDAWPAARASIDLVN
jgi:hypothetical protein